LRQQEAGESARTGTELQQCSHAGDSATLKGRWRPWLFRLTPLIVLGLMGMAVLYLAWRNGLNLQSLAEHHKELEARVRENHAMAFAIYLGLYTLLASLSLPGCVVLSAAGGLLFGWFVGALAAVAGATAGATLFFLLARNSLSAPLTRQFEMRVCRLRAGFQQDALAYLLFLRLTPAFPFGAVNLAAAFLNMRLRDFVLGTFLGIIPATIVFATAGAGIDRLLEAQHTAHEQCVRHLHETAAVLEPRASEPCAVMLTPANFVTRESFLLLFFLGVTALIPALVKKLRKNMRRDA
jgi:uncharacterized membrane protein YdjX (TVP38/TMEM64 family)